MISGVTEAKANAVKATAGMDGLDKDAFLKLLVAQLRYQNPMSPLDGQEYMAQAAQFATVERLQQLQAAQNELIAYQQVTMSSSMVGREVSGLTQFGDEAISGVVTSIRFDGGVPILHLDNGMQIELGNVESIADAASHRTPNPPTT